ncbi:MAG TPA: glycosyltransferase [Bryobacteraceae bacterium]|nr:glycosyltransferase [Bryobacteraceae bacterium]
MRVALVHYWLLGNRGGERVLEAMCRLFPEAEIFTLFYDPESVSPLIRSKVVHASALNPFRRVYRSLLPLMPMALESFDLRSYDLIISSESGPAKGVIAPSTARHVCYCHTPMRYLWELYPAYRNELRSSTLASLMMAPIASYLRTWDFSTASRVGSFFANSENVRRRIWTTYRRQARVVYPPVAIETFYEKPAEDYFLMVSEMVAYKRLDYAISLFSRNGRKLRVVGDGPERSKLKRLARPNVELCGRVSATELQELYARCSAFVMPGEEDFGIAMVEALASGKPVIALGRGGALEIVTRGRGLLYAEPSEASLDEALHTFDQIRSSFEPSFLKSGASAFSESRFKYDFLRGLAAYWSQSRQWHEPTFSVQAVPLPHDGRPAPERRVVAIRESQDIASRGPLA